MERIVLNLLGFSVPVISGRWYGGRSTWKDGPAGYFFTLPARQALAVPRGIG